MKSLVFGGTGRLGKAVAERLKERGDEVHAYGRRIERLPESVNYAIFCQRGRPADEYAASVVFTSRVLDMLGWSDDGDTAIVVVASVAVGIADDLSTLDYQCGKAGAIQLMRHYSTKYRCNAVSPWAFSGTDPKISLYEIVNVIEFLASPLSCGINGQNIIIDRGLQHRWT